MPRFLFSRWGGALARLDGVRFGRLAWGSGLSARVTSQSSVYAIPLGFVGRASLRVAPFGALQLEGALAIGGPRTTDRAGRDFAHFEVSKAVRKSLQVSLRSCLRFSAAPLAEQSHDLQVGRIFRARRVAVGREAQRRRRSRGGPCVAGCAGRSGAP